jgi:hypothetical protein
MMTLTKVVLAGLGLALIKNRNQVVKELQESNKPKVKDNPNTAQEIVNKPVTLEIKPDGFGNIEKSAVITKAPERKITCPEPEKEPEKKLSKLDEYILEQVNAETERLKNDVERENHKEHLYKSHVDNDSDDSKRIQKEIKEGIDSSISVSARDESILKVVENAYMDFKSMNGGSYGVNDFERDALRMAAAKKNITTDAFKAIMDNERHRTNSEFERVMRERGLDRPRFDVRPVTTTSSGIWW